MRIVHPKTVIVSLGTNDGPNGATLRRPGSTKVLRDIGPDACVVWADIYRPARKGPYAALNTTLAYEARHVRRLHLVPWLAAVSAQKVTLPDGLHPDPTGFEYRAQLIADAVHEDCAVPVPTVGGGRMARRAAGARPPAPAAPPRPTPRRPGRPVKNPARRPRIGGSGWATPPLNRPPRGPRSTPPARATTRIRPVR